jgi:hypothetical protein
MLIVHVKISDFSFFRKHSLRWENDALLQGRKADTLFYQIA